MIRRIIHIDEETCNGCGLCASACHEGAIDMVDGKAKLMREDYCDGLGDCLPACPTGAISFEEREAPAYNEDAVKAAQAAKKAQATASHESHRHDSAHSAAQEAPFHGCPGSKARAIFHQPSPAKDAPVCSGQPVSCLSQWPVQIKLVPVQAPYFDGANLLVAADCTAFAYGDFHNRFIRNHVTLIGCPKLDDIDYSEKLEAIIAQNNIKSLTIVRMEVPCCGGIEQAAKTALQRSGKFIPWQVYTVSIDGDILDN